MSVLVDNNNMPLFWPNVFVTMEYRNNSVKTIESVLRALGMFELWGKSKNLAATDKLSDTGFLSANESEDLARFLRLTRKAQDQELAINSSSSQKKVTRLERVRKPFSQLKAKNLFAGRVDAANRIRWVAKYLEFHRNRNVSSFSSHADKTIFKNNADIAISRLQKLVPRGGSFANNENLIGVDDEVIRIVDEALLPSNQSSNNPFSSVFLQARNHLIWRFLAETGMRRSELTHLKVEDIDYSTRRVAIKVSKTLPRTVPISSETANAFHSFVMEHWSKLSAKLTSHGYLFIAEDGKQLEEGTINAIFVRIRESIPGVPDYLTPHTLRRSWNDRYGAKIDALPADLRPSVEEETQIRNRLMGWSDNSSMGARYAKRHIQKKADLIAQELAEDLGRTKESSDD
ncbi:MAG: site-specific integrase [Cellvibrionaceae bacterium]